MNRTNSSILFVVVPLLVLSAPLGTGGCASSGAPPRAEFEEAAIAEPKHEKSVDRNHFRRDKTGNLSEGELRRMLQTPIRFERGSRLGIVPVESEYEVDSGLPVEEVPAALGTSLEETGYFEVATEVATDWPKDRSVAGLRELAARYRSRYLVLYRHRFESNVRVNGWGWTYPTVIGLFATPGKTVRVAGVLEATLFDVQNGSILFTAYERVQTERKMNIWHNRHKRREMKRTLLEEATDELSKSVSAKVRRLAERGGAGSARSQSDRRLPHRTQGTDARAKASE